MSRLPQPGSDDDVWGDILNDFLSVSLNSDGTLKATGTIASAVQTVNGKTGPTVTLSPSDIGAAADSSVVHNTGNESIGGVKTFTSSPVVPTPTGTTDAANKAYVDSVAGGGGGGGGGSSTLAGDTDVAITSPSNNQVLTYNSASGKWVNQNAPSAPVTSVAGKTGAVTLVEGDITNLTADLAAKAPLASPTFTGTVTVPAPSVGTAAATKTYVDNAVSAGSAPDATTSSKGVIQLAGDLSGTATAPTVPGLASKANTATTITGANSVTGGGSLAANRTISLVNDSATPGNSQYYGTDGTGTKGYFSLPSSDPAVGGDLSGTASNAQIVAGAVGNAELAASAVDDGKVSATANIAQSKIANLTSDLAAKAPLASPTFTGTVTVPGPSNATDAATKGYVDSTVSGAQNVTTGTQSDPTATSITATTAGGGTSSTGGTNAVAIGHNASAAGNNTVAIGNGAITNGTGNQNNVSIGHNSISSGSESVAIGDFAAADGNLSINIGTGWAKQDGAISIGTATAAGLNSVGIGSMNVGTIVHADGDGSVAIGVDDTGVGATASGLVGVSIGGGSKANGDISTAIGSYATAGTQSVAIGNSPTAGSSDSVAIGTFAQAHASGGVAIGNFARMDVTQSSSVAIGDNATTNGSLGGTDNVAIGSESDSRGDKSVAIGHFARADGSGSVAVGGNTSLAANGAYAIGDKSLALGTAASAVGAGSVAIGTDHTGARTIANSQDEFVLGTDLHTVKVAGKLIPAASSATQATFNLPHGIAPTTPVDGDVWTTTSGAFARINGITKSLVAAPSNICPAFTYSGTLATYTGDYRWYNDTGRSLTISAARASVGTPPTGSSMIVDVLKNGTTIFTTTSNRPTITATNNTGLSGTPDVTTLANGEYLTINIAQVGSTTPGADLTVTVVMA